jgi:hypothetical protein
MPGQSKDPTVTKTLLPVKGHSRDHNALVTFSPVKGHSRDHNALVTFLFACQRPLEGPQGPQCPRDFFACQRLLEESQCPRDFPFFLSILPLVCSEPLLLLVDDSIALCASCDTTTLQTASRSGSSQDSPPHRHEKWRWFGCRGAAPNYIGPDFLPLQRLQFKNQII